MQLKKLAQERKALWPPPISFSLMGKFEKPKSASDKDDKKDDGLYVKFEVPLNNKDPNLNKYKRKVKIFSDGKPFDWCVFHPKASTGKRCHEWKNHSRPGKVVKTITTILEPPQQSNEREQ
jgi:hypothetical protein